ncbi:MAG: ATP phosphoribosyltransferase [Candidatus Epulonipiscioides saccharophilum]|nr:MAG: ATP phosphoribosyltransferase [Epulopiscium sp. AS2M-Bin001]
MIEVALPKGRLGEKVYKMFKDIGINAKEIESNTRKLFFEDAENDIRFYLIKPSDVAVYVERGAVDIGIAGKDTLVESEADIYELMDLEIGKCNMCVCSPNGFTDTREGNILKIATKYPKIAHAYYGQREIDIIKLNGSIELAPLIGLSHVIVDIVETGSTLRENNLKVDDIILPISARLIASKSRYSFNKDKIDALINQLSTLKNM